jgi:predicted nucleotidyltransferase
VVEATIIESVQNYLHTLAERGVPVRFGVVFGSYAVGKPHKWSDIDLVVVSPRFDQDVQRKDINQLWHAAADTDSRIEPIPCGEREWVEDDSRAILEIARRTGIQVFPEERSAV